MKPLLLLVLLAATDLCGADTLRLSEVVDKAGDGVEQMTLRGGEREEIIFVKKQAVVRDADVKQAWANVPEEGQINVTLKDEGARKLEEVTAKMRHGQDRLAIIVDGKLVSAPVVQAVLGASFLISGLEGMDAGELDRVARKMTGAPPLAAGEAPPKPPVPPQAKAGPRTLKAVFPEVDREAEGGNTVAWIERISFPEPEQAVNAQDLADLVSMTTMLSTILGKEMVEATLDADCDFVKMLSRHFGEVAELRRKKVDGRIKVRFLKEALSPYVIGKKILPEPKAGKAGAADPAKDAN